MFNVVKRRRDGDRNPAFSVVATTSKLITNRAYGYQILDRSRQTKTKYIVGFAINSMMKDRFFRKFNELPNQIYEVKFAEEDHRAQLLVSSFFSLLN